MPVVEHDAPLLLKRLELGLRLVEHGDHFFVDSLREGGLRRLGGGQLGVRRRRVARLPVVVRTGAAELLLLRGDPRVGLGQVCQVISRLGRLLLHARHLVLQFLALHGIGVGGAVKAHPGLGQRGGVAIAGGYLGFACIEARGDGVVLGAALRHLMFKLGRLGLERHDSGVRGGDILGDVGALGGGGLALNLGIAHLSLGGLDLSALLGHGGACPLQRRLRGLQAAVALRGEACDLQRQRCGSAPGVLFALLCGGARLSCSGEVSLQLGH
mmetsp:Transcript_38058/g.94591  ORF Transcript_38058/g.94591 Transcript_38058/m.94591 type:complete len:270 (-) Transcript_38058:2377-3186(-)